LAIFSAALLALSVIPGAQAVHLTPDSSFQLDKDATTETETPQRDDWDRVNAGTDSADVSRFVVDPLGATIFTGGGSKDDLDIPNWAHKSGSVPPKDEISDAYAALYVVDGELRLYFGADRFANNGSSQIGFWFFQNPITLAAGTFSGVHDAGVVPHNDANPGDILILSDFTQGGAISTIRVFEWVGSGGSDGAVNQVAAGVDCFGAVHPPDLCGTVNNEPTPAPWTYTPKFGTAGTFPPGSFYEGGVDLTAFGFENVCFSSFLAETRSSPSVDATLKDFVLGAFPTCAADIVTTPSDDSVFPGDPVRDAATITGSGPTAPAPVGTVEFFLCAKDVSPCATDGTPVGTVDLTGNTRNPVTVFSNFVNTAASPLEPGTYCFAAVWTNDPNYDDDSDRTTGECFTVVQIESVTVTTPVDGSGTPTSTITLGSSIFDRAVVTGTAAGGDPTGTVDFFLCGPIAAPATCTSGGTADPGNPHTLVSDGDPSTFTSSATSSAFTPARVGRYCFRGEYSGSNVYLPSSDSSAGECFTVTTTSSTSSEQTWLPNDSGTVSSAGNNTNLNGTLSFTLYESGDCTGTVLRSAETFTLTNASSPQTRSTTNSTVTVTATTTVSWNVVFTSSDPLVSDSSRCETTSLTITN